MPGHEFDPERLRPAEYLHEPDPRNALTAWCDTTTGFTRQLQAKDLHDAVVGFSLDPAVPEDIAQHFETVKNLFLYSWFIYQFQPIAELQSLACLEYALRVRLENEIRTGKVNEKRPGLQKLLRYAIDNQLVKNEGLIGGFVPETRSGIFSRPWKKHYRELGMIMRTAPTTLPRRRLASSNWFTRLSTNLSRRRPRSNSPARAEVASLLVVSSRVYGP